MWSEDAGVGDRVPGSQCAEPEGHAEDDVRHILPYIGDTNLPETWDRQGDHVQVTYLFATSVTYPEGGKFFPQDQWNQIYLKTSLESVNILKINHIYALLLAKRIY